VKASVHATPDSSTLNASGGAVEVVVMIAVMIAHSASEAVVIDFHFGRC
jgi:hypothetical protein